MAQVMIIDDDVVMCDMLTSMVAGRAPPIRLHALRRDEADRE